MQKSQRKLLNCHSESHIFLWVEVNDFGGGRGLGAPSCCRDNVVTWQRVEDNSRRNGRLERRENKERRRNNNIVSIRLVYYELDAC